MTLHPSLLRLEPVSLFGLSMFNFGLVTFRVRMFIAAVALNL